TAGDRGAGEPVAALRSAREKSAFGRSGNAGRLFRGHLGTFDATAQHYRSGGYCERSASGGGGRGRSAAAYGNGQSESGIVYAWFVGAKNALVSAGARFGANLGVRHV